VQTRESIEGEVVSAEEAAKGCGFFNVAAMEEYEQKYGGRFLAEGLLADVCNLKQQIKQLEARLVATGTERIG